LSGPADHICRRLRELKQRSGRSYEWLAKRTHTSKSSVQRYCTGGGLPPTFGVVESIALACGADRAEVAELFHLWARTGASPGETPDPVGSAPAIAGRDPVGRAPVADTAFRRATSGDAGGVVLAPPVTSVGLGQIVPLEPVPLRGGNSRRGLSATRLTVLLTVLVTIVTASGVAWAYARSREPEPKASVSSQPLPLMNVDPSWTRPPSRVSSTFFGVTLNSLSGAVPEFKVGAVRLWDSGTRWALFEPARGRFDWSLLDRHVVGAERAGLPVLFVFGGTPRWANPDAPVGTYPDGGRTAPPLDLTDWDEAVRAVVQRYRGRIEAYEIWPLGNDARFFSGSVASLVDLSRRAGRIIRAIDPKATILCPGMGNLWTVEGQGVLRRFAEAGGYDQCDVASIKLYQPKASDPPETMLQLATTVDRLLHDAGVQPRIWVTGTTYAITSQPTLDPATARAYAARYYLAGLYGRTLNLERMYFYNWGGAKLPLVLQVEGRPPTAAAMAVDRLQRWLVGADLITCGNGREAGLPPGVWQCRFRRPDTGNGAPAATIRWTLAGSARTTAGPDDRAVQTLAGHTRAVRTGDRITLGPEPVLIEQSS
jgi:hypothetical protein